MGFVQSRLYNGSWNQDELWQDFSLRFIKGSWLYIKGAKFGMEGRVGYFQERHKRFGGVVSSLIPRRLMEGS